MSGTFKDLVVGIDFGNVVFLCSVVFVNGSLDLSGRRYFDARVVIVVRYPSVLSGELAGVIGGKIDCCFFTEPVCNSAVDVFTDVGIAV